MKYHYECSVKDKGFLPFYGITKNSNEYFLVFEYAENGNLREYLQREEWKTMTIVDKLKILYDILNDLKTIHRNGLVHNGIHSRNILITASKVKRAYICDLGLTKSENSKKEYKYRVLEYTAPEVLQRKGQTKASDIYAIGILIWEIIHGQCPFSHYSDIHEKIIDGERPKFTVKCHKLLYTLTKWCWHENPIRRPTIDLTLKVVFNLLCHKKFECELPCSYCELPLIPSPQGSFCTNSGTEHSSSLSYKTSFSDDDEPLHNDSKTDKSFIVHCQNYIETLITMPKVNAILRNPLKHGIPTLDFFWDCYQTSISSNYPN
ncbi:5495_t:CDS:2 [Ambispora leptoticha]|uniref:5495_t:CDS:1 n=1 Tax=Ambispora leptoticha TaxID=144679 RepID=A0A9N9BV03_9GLOM|nr:5495_t:CDS:2 [Ambispora leptoticha]